MNIIRKGEITKIMNVLNVEIQEKIRTTIEFISNESILIESKITINYKDEEHYFKVISIKTGEDRVLFIKAKEIGYWAKKFDRINNFDIRDLLGIDVELVTDKCKIEQINLETSWC